MKRFVPFLVILSFLIPGWRNHQSQIVVNRIAESGEQTNTTLYPLFIDGGTKIVYQVGQLTPDKGLKLYLDTIPNPVGGLQLDDAVRKEISAE